MLSPLRNLVLLDGEYQKLIRNVRAYLQHARATQPEALEVVRLDDVDHALSMYENNTISSEQLREWADILEMNDYVRYEYGVEEVVADLLFRISTPEINEPITRDFARKLRFSLRKLRDRR
jgi:hypothetical protein